MRPDGINVSAAFLDSCGPKQRTRAIKIIADSTRYYLGEHIAHRGFISSVHTVGRRELYIYIYICIAIPKILRPRSFFSYDALERNKISLSRRFYCVESDEQCLKWRFRGGFHISIININLPYKLRQERFRHQFRSWAMVVRASYNRCSGQKYGS